MVAPKSPEQLTIPHEALDRSNGFRAAVIEFVKKMIEAARKESDADIETKRRNDE